MNLRQKSYDSFDKTNKLLKLTNSYYHKRNLDLIRNRKSQYLQPEKYTHKRQYLEPFKDYYVIKENIGITNKLKDIRCKPVKPKINEYFLLKEGKIQDFRKQHQVIADSLRDKDNEKYRERINAQKAFINPTELDKEYEENHAKIVQKLRRLGAGDNIVLPPIKDGKKNPILEQSKKRYATEGSKKGGSSSGDESGDSSDKEDSSDNKDDKEESKEESKE